MSLPSPSPAFSPRHCFRCQTSDSSRWRTGPDGFNTLCNPCGRLYAARKIPLYQDLINGRLSISHFPNARLVAVTNFYTRFHTDFPARPSRRVQRDLTNPVVVPIHADATMHPWRYVRPDYLAEGTEGAARVQGDDAFRLPLVTSRASLLPHNFPGLEQGGSRPRAVNHGGRASEDHRDSGCDGEHREKSGADESNTHSGRGGYDSRCGGGGQNLRRGGSGVLRHDGECVTGRRSGQGDEHPREKSQGNEERDEVVPMELEEDSDEGWVDDSESSSPPCSNKKKGFARFRGKRVWLSEDRDYVPDASDREGSESSEGSVEPEDPLSPLSVIGDRDIYTRGDNNSSEEEKEGSGGREVTGVVRETTKKRRLTRRKEFPQSDREVLTSDVVEDMVCEANEDDGNGFVEVPLVLDGRVEGRADEISQRAVGADESFDLQVVENNATHVDEDVATPQRPSQAAAVVVNMSGTTRGSPPTNEEYRFACKDDASGCKKGGEDITDTAARTSDRNHGNHFDIAFVNGAVGTGDATDDCDCKGRDIRKMDDTDRDNFEVLSNQQAMSCKSQLCEGQSLHMANDIKDSVTFKMPKAAAIELLEEPSNNNNVKEELANVTSKNLYSTDKGCSENAEGRTVPLERENFDYKGGEATLISSDENGGGGGVYSSPVEPEEGVSHAPDEVVAPPIKIDGELLPDAFGKDGGESPHLNEDVFEDSKEQKGRGVQTKSPFDGSEDIKAEISSRNACDPQPFTNDQLSAKANPTASIKVGYNTENMYSNSTRDNPRPECAVSAQKDDMIAHHHRDSRRSNGVTTEGILSGKVEPKATDKVAVNSIFNEARVLPKDSASTDEAHLVPASDLSKRDKPKKIPDSLSSRIDEVEKCDRAKASEQNDNTNCCFKYRTKSAAMTTKLHSDKPSIDFEIRTPSSSQKRLHNSGDIKAATKRATVELGERAPAKSHQTNYESMELLATTDCSTEKAEQEAVTFKENSVMWSTNAVGEKETIEKRADGISLNVSKEAAMRNEKKVKMTNQILKKNDKANVKVCAFGHAEAHSLIPKSEEITAERTDVTELTVSNSSQENITFASNNVNNEETTSLKWSAAPFSDIRMKDGALEEKTRTPVGFFNSNGENNNGEGEVEGSNFRMMTGGAKARMKTTQTMHSCLAEHLSREKHLGQFQTAAAALETRIKTKNNVDEQRIMEQMRGKSNANRGYRMPSTHETAQNNRDDIQVGNTVSKNKSLDVLQTNGGVQQSSLTASKSFAPPFALTNSAIAESAAQNQRRTTPLTKRRRLDSNVSGASPVQRQHSSDGAKLMSTDFGNDQNCPGGKMSRPILSTLQLSPSPAQVDDRSSTADVSSSPATFTARPSPQRHEYVSAPNVLAPFRPICSSNPGQPALLSTPLWSEENMKPALDHQSLVAQQRLPFILDPSFSGPSSFPEAPLCVGVQASAQPTTIPTHNLSMIAANVPFPRSDLSRTGCLNAGSHMNTAMSSQLPIIHVNNAVQPSKQFMSTNQESRYTHGIGQYNSNSANPGWLSSSASTTDAIQPYSKAPGLSLSFRAQRQVVDETTLSPFTNQYFPSSSGAYKIIQPPINLAGAASSNPENFHSRSVHNELCYQQQASIPHLIPRQSSTNIPSHDSFRPLLVSNMIAERTVTATAASAPANQCCVTPLADPAITNQVASWHPIAGQNTPVSNSALQAFGSSSACGGERTEWKWNEHGSFWTQDKLPQARRHQHYQMFLVKVEYMQQFRRLSLHRDTTFVAFKAMVATAFQLRGIVNLRYLDNENDYITLSSLNDMKELFVLAQLYRLSPIRVQVNVNS